MLKKIIVRLHYLYKRQLLIIQMNEKIGIIVMFRIEGGGAPNVLVNAIRSLNEMGKKVYLLTPFEVDFDLIEKNFGKIEIEKIYYPKGLKRVFCQGNFLPRRFMKEELLEMIDEVDLIIDIDGGIMHEYLPVDFDDSRYIIWRFSGVNIHLDHDWDWNRKAKEYAKIALGSRKCIPSDKHKIYASDKWTSEDMKKNWNLDSEKLFLYPRINVEDFINKDFEKKNQIAVFGRIAPSKQVEDSIKIFAEGSKEHSDYNLVIFGAGTADTQEYVSKLRKLISELGISHRVSIIPSPTFFQLKQLLLESKILLDSQGRVSNTLTSIEALAAGNVVVVNKNSGCYTEVLRNGELGFGFDNIEEGCRVLADVLNRIDGIDVSRSVERSKDFSGDKFNNRLRLVVDNGL
jgi:glycosyltransferase involved in cell wall biosynthesis